jgi:hypothetical protein
MGFQSVEKKCDCQQVGAAARAETTDHEGSMHCDGSLAPVCLLDPSLFENVCRQNISDIWFGNLREYLAHLV